jgi:ABC-type uncharacterized transport system permease subunit
MSAFTLDKQQPQPAPDAPIVLETVVVRSWKAPIAFGIFTVIAFLLFVIWHRDGNSTFRLSSEGDVIQLPTVVLPSTVTGIVVTILLAAITALSAYLVTTGKRIPLWLITVFGVLFMVGFLSWAAAGKAIPITGLLLGTVALSVPLIFGALGGVISERVGVVNIAIEGQLLAGAFSSAFVASVTGNAVLGLVAAMINVLVVGLTSFLYAQVLTKNEALFNSPPKFPRINIPILSEIPLIGPVLFRQTIIIYLMYIAVAVVFYCLFSTRWGLRLRAVGEHPQAADTVGINVNRTRFWNVALAGAIVGLGGAYFTLGSVGAFNKEMTAGAGYIALAAVIFGRWDPLKATLAALLFGFTQNLQFALSAIGSPVPSAFMLMLPYVVTIFAVAGLVGVSRGPAAAGKPYVKG